MAGRSRKRVRRQPDGTKRETTAAVALDQSPGRIDGAYGGILKGWISLPHAQELDVYTDGNFVGTASAVDGRRDQDGAPLNSLAKWFHFQLPSEFVDGSEHEFEIRPAGQKRRSKNPLMGKLSVSLFMNAPTAVNGWIDGIRDGVLYGWYAVPTGSRLIIVADDKFIGTTRNNILRDDVIAAGFAGDPVGFEIELPESLRDGAEHSFEIRQASADIRAEFLFRTLAVEKVSSAQVSKKRKSRAAVICWDLGHNPAGRALVLVQVLERLYDEVYLIGPLFQRFGGTLWGPISSNKRLRIVADKVKNFAELEAFQKKVVKQKYDFVYLCKPRWPTLYLGIRLAQASECRVALDIDDYELSFFKVGKTPVSLDGIVERIRHDQTSPIDLEATLLAHSAVELFPLITVSNIALQKKFGGSIIRHARDETEFDPAIYNRDQIRHSYGYGINDKVILFVGTIRRHKGVVRLAEAIAQLSQPNVKLCLIGPIAEPTIETEIRDLLGPRVCFHEGIPFSALAATTLLADLVCLPQELDSEVSQYQIPAKLTDALSMGVPVIAEDLPPFHDLANVPGVYIRKSGSLAKLIPKVLQSGKKQRYGVREYFLSEFSTAAAADRLSRLISSSPAADLRRWSSAAQKIGSGYQEAPPAVNPTAVAISKRRGQDVVFLWKQNDSGLFGRRSDMVMKHLLKQGFAGRVLQFDAASSLDSIIRLEERATQKPLSSDGMIYRNIVSRFLGLSHDLEVSRFTIVYDNKRRSFLGRTLPAEADIPDILRAHFRAERLSEEALLWMCPVAFDFDLFTAARNFPFKIVDLIDDQRSFSSNDDYKRKLSEHYALAMASADIIFANCEGVAERFSNLTKKSIHVISNAAERMSRKDIQPIDIFAGRNDILRIGYVGNLRDRIDLDLLIKIAEAKASWQLILVGPTGGRTSIEDLGRYPHVTLLGPQRYEDSIRIAASFDVAIIPHSIGDLTDSMNPLKLYMYQMLGLPVVSTAVENMTGANDMVRVARTHSEFLRHLRKIELGPRRRAAPRTHLEGNVYWDDNVASMIRIINENLNGSKSTQ